VFCIYLRTNSDLCHLQHKLVGFYNRDEKCLQRGTDWVFKESSLRFVFKGLTCHIQITTKEADILAQSSAGTKYQFRPDRRLSAISPGDSAVCHLHLFPSNAFAPHRHTIQATRHTIRYNLRGSNGSFHKANINNSH
jgi:hypothetical protein